MKISIIDIGTQSLKHYIFEVNGSEKKTLHFNRYSDLSLGVAESIPEDAFLRATRLLETCAALNKKENVEKVKVLGTEALRKAKNAVDFAALVENILGTKPEIISQENEALYLYKGFLPIIPRGQNFAAVNAGGGSTELVTGSADRLESSHKFPFGVKLLKQKFLSASGEMDWVGIDAYLEKEIVVQEKMPLLFVTGVLRFVEAVSGPLHLAYKRGEFKDHPMLFTLPEFEAYVQALRTTPLEELKKIYTQDPSFCDNIAVGQSLYLAIAKKVGAISIFPSNNDLTDGVIESLI